jgi:GNAT superfamily N-acetyltransferase
MSIDPRMAAFEANVVATVTVGRGLPWADVRDDLDAVSVVTDIPWTWPNAVCGVRLESATADGRIDELLAPFRARQRRMRWWIPPTSTPDDLLERLVAHGLEAEFADDAMACDLTDWHPSKPADGVAIERVVDTATFHTWTETFAYGFGGRPGSSDAIFERYYVDVAVGATSPIATYLARLDGEPVATAFGRSSGGVVGVYAVATVPAARRRGIGAAITSRLMTDAWAGGARLAVLSASDMGRSVYERLGFEAIGLVQTALGPFGVSEA